MAIVPFLVNLPPDIYELLDSFCRQRKITKTEIVREGVRKELARRERRILKEVVST